MHENLIEYHQFNILLAVGWVSYEALSAIKTRCYIFQYYELFKSTDTLKFVVKNAL